MKNIIFVCTDNIGRSLIGEYVLKDYLKKNQINGIDVASTGTDALSDITGFSMAHFNELKKLGIVVSDHKRTQLTKELANNADLLIAFDKTQQKWIKNNLGLEAPLFNQIYKNENSEIKFSNFDGDKNTRAVLLTRYIQQAMPVLFENIKKEYI